MNQIDLKEKVAVVTGSARGIGLAIARRLAASGASVSLWDQDAVELKKAEPHLVHARGIHTTAVNVTDPQAVRAAATAVQKHFGGIDILVNNAGIAGASKNLWDYPPEEWWKVVEIDLYSVFLCCHAVVPIMRERNYGRIVNVSSVAGKEGNPLASAYSAAKAGVIALTKSLGKELAQTPIRVNCITPAVIETEILRQLSQEHLDYMLAKIPLRRPGKVDEVAALVAWLCSEECSFSTGATFDITGGRATY